MKGNILTTIITCLEIHVIPFFLYLYLKLDSHEQTLYLKIIVVHLIYDRGSSLNYPLTADISKYAGTSDLTGKNQAGPTMFSAYLSKSPAKICSLLWSGNNFLKQCL